MGRDEYAGQNVELEPLTQNGQQFGQQSDPNAILNECREIDEAIEMIRKNLKEIERLQAIVISDANTSPNAPSTKNLDAAALRTMDLYRNLTHRVRNIKSKPESGSTRNAPQVGRIDRQLKDAIHNYQTIDRAFQNKLQKQMAHQYLIVHPEASEDEAKNAVKDSSHQQIFSQALLQGNRTGQAQSTLSAVQSRHEAIKKIEQQVLELAELFNEMDTLVVQQEAAVTNIEMKGEEVVDNMDKGTAQIGVAIKSARNARKWKWWCLGISVLIIAIIVIVVLLYVYVFGPNAPSNRAKPAPASAPAKRFVLPSSLTTEHLVVPGKPFTGADNIVVPGLEWTGHNKLVNSPLSTKRERYFSA